MPLFDSQQLLDLAMEHHRARRFAAAESLYRQVLARHPDSADVVQMLGLIAYETGRFVEALDWMQRSIRAQPEVAHYHNNLGLLLADSDRLEESAAAFESALRLEPTNSLFHYNLGNTRRRQRQWDAAITAYRQALQIQPGHVWSWLNLGLTLASADRPEEALAAYRAGQQHHPREVSLGVNLSSLLQDLGRTDEAITVAHAALALTPGHPILLNNLGTLHKDRGEIAEALALIRKSLAKEPNAEVQDNLIFTSLLDPDARLETIVEEQRQWNLRFAAPLRALRPRHVPEREPGGRLRIGYVSADLRDHVVGRTLLPILEAHDRAAIECVCYAGGATDAVARRFQARAEHWRNMERWTDAELAAQVHADGIDILVDLGLHTAYNRLLAFARKPAPVQVSWLGYPGSAGVETIDYWLTDRFLDPPEAVVPEFAGRPWRLPDAWCCYSAPADSPGVNEPPAGHNGFITFGSFNNFSKINPRVLEVWIRILHAVPASRLLLLAKAGSHRDRVQSLLKKSGIAAKRCQILDYQPASPERTAGGYLHRYAQVDIALDPFPYNGMTTTFDALWMGVPVVSLAGRTAVSRGGLSILSNLGLPELVACTEDEYVRLATELASDLPRLADLRATLRPRMKASVLMDAPRLARHVEDAYRSIWQQS